MPHDTKGNQLQVGDKVIIRAVIKSITSETEVACNVVASVESDHDEYKPDIAMNAKNVEFASRGEPK